MSFTISGLDPAPFRQFFTMTAGQLAAHGASILNAGDSNPGAPCRVSLGHAAPGERLLLINHCHQPAPTPYRSSHAIFVAEQSREKAVVTDAIPEALACRTLSIRAFDRDGMMLDADLVEGTHAPVLIEQLLALPGAAYLHAHYARRGCFAAMITR